MNNKLNGLVIDPEGNKRWYKDGLLHKEDGPACEYADGSKSWWKNGSLHNEKGPAFLRFNGDEEWYKNGYRHREDGPAIIGHYGKSWFSNGKKLEVNSLEEFKRLINLKLFW